MFVDIVEHDNNEHDNKVGKGVNIGSKKTEGNEKSVGREGWLGSPALLNRWVQYCCFVCPGWLALVYFLEHIKFPNTPSPFLLITFNVWCCHVVGTSYL